MAVFLDSESAKERGRITLCVPSLKLSEFLLKLGGPYAVCIAEIRLGIERVLLFHDIPEDSVSLQDSVHHREVIKLEVILLKDAHTLSGTLGNGAVGRGELSGENPHEGRLTSAIGSDDAIAVAGSEFHVDILEEDALAKLYAEVVDSNHAVKIFEGAKFGKKREISCGNNGEYVILRDMSSDVNEASRRTLTAPGTHSVEAGGTRIAYFVSGEGSPLVLMHGWGCDSSTIASVGAVASESHKVFNIDFPGFGGSPEPPANWGVEEYTRALEDFVRILGLENVSLAGHSFGGRVAIVYASRNKVDKLMLIDAAGVKPRRGLKYYGKVYSFKLMKSLAKLFLPASKADAAIEGMRRKRGSADYAAASPVMREIFKKVVNEDLTRFMPLIDAETLLVWGEDDTATPMRDARIMKKLIPGAGLVSFPGCGHYSFLDNRAGFAAVARSFLTK